MRLPAEQISPWFPKMPPALPSIAASNGESEKMMFGDFPPSSSVTRFNVSAELFITSFPTSSDPVKPILSTFGLATRGAPAVSPNPVTTLKTPAGSPASSRIAGSSNAVSGVCSAGFNTTAAARGEGRGHLLHRHHQRVVPGNDQTRDPYWLFDDEAHRVRPDRRYLAGDLRRPSGEVLEHVCGFVDVLDGLRERLAGVERLELGEAARLAPHDVGRTQ